MFRATMFCFFLLASVLTRSSGATNTSEDSGAAAPGVTYYVHAEHGNDIHDGKHPESAFRSLKRAVAALNRKGGDTLVLEGTFRETLNLSSINNPHGGQPDSNRPTLVRCALDADGTRRPAVIDGGIPLQSDAFPFDCQGKKPGFGPGTDNHYLNRGLIISQSNYVTIDGITVQGIAGLGVLTWRSSHITLRNVTVQWTSQSALMLSHGRPTDPMVRDLTIENCRINQSNLGYWRDRGDPDPHKRGYEMRSETVSIVRWDGFQVHHNHISNSLMEGIDFKEGSCHGEIHHNLVEQCRSAGIYANEGCDTKIFRNVVRRIGYYDPQDGSGLRRGGKYLSTKLPGSNVGEPGATAILISNGDLDGPGRPPLEVGRVSGIEVYENVISWTRKAAVSVWNQWRKRHKEGWIVDNIRIDNNVCYKTCLGPNPVSAAILFDAAATNVRIRNNIIVGSDKFDLEKWNRPEWPQPAKPPRHAITHNLFHKNASHHTSGQHPITADPRFRDPPETLLSKADFHLRDDSPARDAGTDTGLPRFDDTPRDIGAYEYGLRSWHAGPATFLDNGVTAHRGNSGEFPENTLPAFQSGIDVGADWIELDIFRTRDGKLVVIHDRTTGRVGDQNLVVAEATYDALGKVDVATDFRRRMGKTKERCGPQKIPLLEDVLQLVLKQNRTRVSIQPKMDCVADALALIKSMKAERWVGFNDGNLQFMAEVKRQAPNIPVFWDRGKDSDIDKDIRIARKYGFESLVLQYEGMTAEKVAKIKAANLHVGAWTVDDKATMIRLLDMGVQRIYTDFPRRLLALKSKR